MPNIYVNDRAVAAPEAFRAVWLLVAGSGGAAVTRRQSLRAAIETPAFGGMLR